jgi:hypothetical protein
MTPVAHVGHWLVETLYVVPVLAVVVWISVRSILDRRASEAEPPAGEGREPGAPA